MSEGVIAKYDGYQIFAFKYKNNSDQKKWFANACDSLKSSTHFEQINSQSNELTMVDRNGRDVAVQSYENFIFIIIGEKNVSTNSVLGKIKAKVSNLN